MSINTIIKLVVLILWITIVVKYCNLIFLPYISYYLDVLYSNNKHIIKIIYFLIKNIFSVRELHQEIKIAKVFYKPYKPYKKYEGEKISLLGFGRYMSKNSEFYGYLYFFICVIVDRLIL